MTQHSSLRIKEDRFRAISAALAGAPTVSLTELADICGGVSLMTVRRDLSEMEAQGALRRVRGGAVRSGSADPGYTQRAQENLSSKTAIARAAASLPRSGMTVFLDAGSTLSALARDLARRASVENLRLRVVTPSVAITSALSGTEGITLHQLGGEIDHTLMAVTGDMVLNQISEMNFDLFVMGATGADPVQGFTNSSPLGIALKRMVHERASETWAVTDASKWRRVDAYRVIEMGSATGWICDADLTADEIQQVKSTGAELRLVSRTEDEQ